MIQMYDSWVEALDKGEMAGVTMIDQSAAFDCVDHGILMSKLKLYGFDQEALAWMEGYLSGRVQSCHVESFTSPALAVTVGVPPRLHSWAPDLLHIYKRFPRDSSWYRMSTITP